jgi:hypothetical protein
LFFYLCFYLKKTDSRVLGKMFLPQEN